MAQKTKVKELVGRGLNSYHTKSLQQMDRIEKKNKEQNHKISILSNELDNDYLTKIEEGSVVSLEHSKEGMIYLDELQGNTMVNYCTDGSKEMTLNGDIDLEGTFVTTTEGVDNGKVDVICEGNTLVNLKYGSDGYDCNIAWANSGTIEYFNRQEYSKIHCKGEIVETANNLGISWIYHVMGQVKLHLLKPNTTYTIKLNNKYDCITSILIQAGNATSSYIKSYQKIDKDTYLIITKDSFEELSTNGVILYGTLSKDYKGSVDYKIIGMFEGDCSNKELPNDFFEGMKSVGQDNENGHKIEILSQNKNLFDGVVSSEYSHEYINFNVSSDGVLSATNKTTDDRSWAYDRSQYRMKLKKGNYTITLETITPSTSKYSQTIIYKKGVTNSLCMFGISTMDRVGSNSCQISLNEDSDIGIESKFFDGTFRIQIEKGNQSTTFAPYKSNKKEILLNEPLRYTGSTRDRFVKMGGKIFIERNTIELLLDKSVTNIGISSMDFTNKDIQLFFIRDFNNIIKSSTNNETWLNLLSDKFNSNAYNTLHRNNIEGVAITQDGAIGISILKSRLSTVDIDGFKQWLSNNNVKIICELATPIYEPLEIEPVLSCYLEVTHISNNSIIPCNMKIKNSGYNAIIKPSTLYTVALDTNKSGTIGMNLGGAKGTTTNNVLTLTTPATLADDSLRLYGKGIKGSKVRLLEGDKTNWIPSHFEGMKSSFEDKVQDDGSYKMEILMSNRNLFSTKDISYKGAGTNGRIDILTDELIQFTNTEKTYTQAFMVLRLKPFTTYKLSAELQLMQIHVFYGRVSGWDANKYFADINNLNSSNLILKTKEFTTDKSGIITLRTTNEQKIGTNIAKNIIVEEIDGGNYVPHKQNKIQFSSIEPLRSVDNVKDRFVFKDNKLMVERNCGVYTYNGATQQQWQIESFGVNNYTKFVGYNFPNALSEKCKSNLASYGTDKAGISVRIAPTVNRVVFVNNYFQDISNTTERIQKLKEYLSNNNLTFTYQLAEPTYEEIPFELQKIILEGYENGTLFFDTNIPPTSTVTYAGETPIVKSVKLNKTEVLNNTNDINDNIIPYLMDMDYRVVCLQLESNIEGISMVRLFGGTYEMLKRDIQSNRLTKEEYRYRLADYFNAGKLTEQEVRELEDLR